MDFSWHTFVNMFLLKTLIATACGGIIGFERQMRQKIAGLKTNILICVGASLYTTMGMTLDGDHTRVSAQIVSGIGFLGAGAIFRSADRVQGLTTATMVWVVGALGIVIGAGFGIHALLLAAGMVTMIVVVNKAEATLDKWFGPKKRRSN